MNGTLMLSRTRGWARMVLSTQTNRCPSNVVEMWSRCSDEESGEVKLLVVVTSFRITR